MMQIIVMGRFPDRRGDGGRASGWVGPASASKPEDAATQKAASAAVPERNLRRLMSCAIESGG